MPVEKQPLRLKDAKPLDLNNYIFEWTVIVEEDTVWYAITPDGYSNLSVIMLMLRNHIEQQREITNIYRNYYEGEKEENEIRNQD